MHNINIEDIFGNFGDIFEGMFGGSGRRQQDHGVAQTCAFASR